MNAYLVKHNDSHEQDPGISDIRNPNFIHDMAAYLVTQQCWKGHMKSHRSSSFHPPLSTFTTTSTLFKNPISNSCDHDDDRRTTIHLHPHPGTHKPTSIRIPSPCHHLRSYLQHHGRAKNSSVRTSSPESLRYATGGSRHLG